MISFTESQRKMFRILLRKYQSESRLLWLACGFMLLIFPWVRIWTVSQFELSGFAPLIEQFRSFEKFSPVPLEQFLTYEGLIALTYDEPILILCIMVWCVSRGSDVISGEIGRGTMEMLLAQPIGRKQILLAHATISILGLVLLVILAYAGLYIGIATNSTPVSIRENTFRIPEILFDVLNLLAEPTKSSDAAPAKSWVPLSTLVSPGLYVPASINLFALGFFILGLSVLMSSWDQYRWRTIGIVMSIYVLQLLTFVLAKSVVWLNWLKAFTFFAAYQPDWIVQIGKSHPQHQWSFWISAESSLHAQLGPMSYVTILIIGGVVNFALATYLFVRRDVPAPL